MHRSADVQSIPAAASTADTARTLALALHTILDTHEADTDVHRVAAPVNDRSGWGAPSLPAVAHSLKSRINSHVASERTPAQENWHFFDLPTTAAVVAFGPAGDDLTCTTLVNACRLAIIAHFAQTDAVFAA